MDMKPKPTVTETLRKMLAQRATIESRYRMSGRTGLDEAVLSRFLRGGVPSANTIDVLAEDFGMELRAVRKPKKTVVRKQKGAE
jgi:hypothetical protein